jgi:hypothetical protein
MKREKGATKQGIGIQALMLDNELIRNQKEMAETFNNYFLPIAKMIGLNSCECQRR